MYRHLLPPNAVTALGFALLGLGGLLQFALGYRTAEKIADGVALDVSYAQAGLVGGLLVRGGLLVLAWALLFDDPGREVHVAERCVRLAGGVALILAFAFAA